MAGVLAGPDDRGGRAGTGQAGAGPLEALFGQACRPLAAPGSPGSFYRGWRMVALDGTRLEVPDTQENVARFGRPGSARGTGGGAYPQVRLAALGECGTHAVFAAAMGPLSVHETDLARRIFPRLGPGMLMTADRGFLGLDLWREAAATGADLLWRVKSPAVLPPDEELPDGSYLSRIYAARDKRRHGDPEVVRVIEYTLDDPGTVYRLMTTILDPEQAPAADLAALHSQRWEIELVFDELKTHQGAPRMVLRSQSPPGVAQEAWGFLLVHYALRALMSRAAAEEGPDPDRLSFTRTLRIARRQVTAQAAFPPLPPGQGTDGGDG